MGSKSVPRCWGGRGGKRRWLSGNRLIPLNRGIESLDQNLIERRDVRPAAVGAGDGQADVNAIRQIDDVGADELPIGAVGRSPGGDRVALPREVEPAWG